MAGSKTFSIATPVVSDPKDVTVLVTLFNNLLTHINDTVGAGNWKLADTSVSGSTGKAHISDGTNQLILDHVLTADKVVDLDTTGDASGKIIQSDGSGNFTLTTNTASPAYSSQSGSFTIAVNTKRMVNAGVTVTLPNSPSDGDSVWVKPSSGQDLTASALTIAQNGDGDTIGGAAENATLSLNAEYQLIYDSSEGDWDIVFGIIGR